MPGYAVVDVETTGLNPGGRDRVLEIAIVRLDANYRPIGSWSTLINPLRDVGPTRIHGIMAGDVRNAPTFATVAGDVAELLQGSITVAHNASFDIRFLAAEFTRCGCEISPWGGVCTMHMAKRLGVGSSLSDCCDHLGISQGASHHALTDAMATAMLFELMSGMGDISVPDPLIDSRFSVLPISRQTHCRGEAVLELGRVPSGNIRLEPDQKSSEVDLATPVVMEYFNNLDEVLEDRVIENHEADTLAKTAERLSLSSKQCAELHLAYIKAVLADYRNDGQISLAEGRDLDRLQSLLGTIDWRTLEEGKQFAPLAPGHLNGMTVCFSGDSGCILDGQEMTKAKASELIEGRGMIFAASITKKVDVLVVADPDTQSGKAKKARKYGIRIIYERAFWRRIGVQVD